MAEGSVGGHRPSERLKFRRCLSRVNSRGLTKEVNHVLSTKMRFIVWEISKEHHILRLALDASSSPGVFALCALGPPGFTLESPLSFFVACSRESCRSRGLFEEISRSEVEDEAP